MRYQLTLSGTSRLRGRAANAPRRASGVGMREHPAGVERRRQRGRSGMHGMFARLPAW